MSKEPHHVVAFYALATTSVARAELPGRMRRNAPDLVPAMLVARLAVDKTHQGAGLGKGMLCEAMKRTIEIAGAAGVRMLIVHAIDDDAALFYRTFSFIDLPAVDGSLFLPVETIVAAL